MSVCSVYHVHERIQNKKLEVLLAQRQDHPSIAKERMSGEPQPGDFLLLRTKCDGTSVN